MGIPKGHPESPGGLDWGNGWTDWDISFADYLEGSATSEPVER